MVFECRSRYWYVLLCLCVVKFATSPHCPSNHIYCTLPPPAGLMVDCFPPIGNTTPSFVYAHDIKWSLLARLTYYKHAFTLWPYGIGNVTGTILPTHVPLTHAWRSCKKTFSWFFCVRPIFALGSQRTDLDENRNRKRKRKRYLLDHG